MMKHSVFCLAVTMALASMSVQAYTAGTYEAETSGLNGPIKVQVTVTADAITAVKVLAQRETDGIGSKAIESMPAAFVKANGTNVDTVSGATVTSDALKLAVGAALAKARGEATDKVEFKPGTYKARAYGNNDYLNVEVTVDKDRITSIKVPGHHETIFMGEMAIEKLTDEILRYQTLNVDAVAGATVTSAAFKKAVADALLQSGVNLAALQTPIPPQGKRSSGTTEEDYDLVIVGSGGAGLSAAVTATENAKRKVIVLEKMPVIGGNTLRCASAYNAADPERQKALPMTNTLKEAVQKAISEKPVSPEHAKLMADVKAKYDAYLASGSTTLFDCPEWHALQTYNGGDKVGLIPVIRTYADNALDTLHWMEAHGTPVLNRVSQGAGALWQRTHQVDAPAGTGLVKPLYDAAIKQGAKIVTGMKAEKLIVKDGKVVGVSATDTLGNEYNFMSTYGVILATGGYSQNKELRQKSSPVLTPDMVSTNQPGGMCWDINDSSIVQPVNSFAENVETLVKLGRIYKADTLADLAKQLGMPPANLEKTVAEFNAMVDAKEDTQFGRKLFDRKIEKAPFYATPRAPSIHHTMGGLLINPKAQVLDINGRVIPGLYAAGEVTGGIHGSNRLGGNATADVLTFGRIAAKTALDLQ